jgi:predicted SnoaL-like aldol condensation-catalyzing enzyme
MTPKQIVASYMQQVWVEKNVAAVDTFISSDLIQHNANLLDGAAALKMFLPKLFGELMPQLQWRVLRIIGDHDMVAVHSHAVPTPGALGMVVVDLFRVADNQIAEHWDVTHDVPQTTASGRYVF